MLEQLIDFAKTDKNNYIYRIYQERILSELKVHLEHSSEKTLEHFNFIFDNSHVFQALTEFANDAIKLATIFPNQKESLLLKLLQDELFLDYLFSHSDTVEKLLSCFNLYEDKIFEYIFLNHDRFNKLLKNPYYLWVVIRHLNRYQDQALLIILNSDSLFNTCIGVMHDGYGCSTFLKKLISIFGPDEDNLIKNIFSNTEIFRRIAQKPPLLLGLIESIVKNRDMAINLILDSDEKFSILFNSVGFIEYFTDCYPSYSKKIQGILLKPEHFFHAVHHLDELLNSGLSFTKNDLFDLTVSILTNNAKDIGKSESSLLILDFLKGTEALCYNVDPIAMAYEMISMVNHPERIDQGSTNLCGPAAFLMTLMSIHPALGISQFLQLIRTGKTSSPLNLRSNDESKKMDNSFSKIFLSAIKNTSNWIMGYSYTRFEQLLGVTEPSILCKWLRKCNFEKIREATVITNSSGKETAWYHRMIVGGVYDFGHQHFDTLEKNLKEAVKDVASGKKVILLVSNQFKLGNGFVYQSKQYFNTTFNPPILGIRMGHYIVANKLQYNEKDHEIHITAWSTGKEYTMIINSEAFFIHYQGFISALPKEQLSNKLSNKEEPINSIKQITSDTIYQLSNPKFSSPIHIGKTSQNQKSFSSNVDIESQDSFTL